MSNLLVMFESNYADEFDVAGVKIMTKEEFDSYMKTWSALIKKGVEWYFGTNEQITFNSVKEFRSCFTSKVLEESAHKLFMSLFPKGEFGNFPDIENCNVYDDEY